MLRNDEALATEAASPKAKGAAQIFHILFSRFFYLFYSLCQNILTFNLQEEQVPQKERTKKTSCPPVKAYNAFYDLSTPSAGPVCLSVATKFIANHSLKNKIHVF